MGSVDSDEFTRHHFGLEYGITDHWMIDGRITELDEHGLHLDSSRLETRYRFFDEGTLPIDIALSGEVNIHRDEQGPSDFWYRAAADPLQGLWQAQPHG